MSEKMTSEERIERAFKMVHALCQPRGSVDGREWIMSIPALPDHDPDLIIADGLMAGYNALTENADLKRRAEAFHEAYLALQAYKRNNTGENAQRYHAAQKAVLELKKKL